MPKTEAPEVVQPATPEAVQTVETPTEQDPGVIVRVPFDDATVNAVADEAEQAAADLPVRIAPDSAL